MLDSKNKKRLTEISFQICVSLGLFLSFRRWAICLYLECEVKVFLTFAPYSFLIFPLSIRYVPTTPNNSQKDILDGKASLYFSNVLPFHLIFVYLFEVNESFLPLSTFAAY